MWTQSMWQALLKCFRWTISNPSAKDKTGIISSALRTMCRQVQRLAQGDCHSWPSDQVPMLPNAKPFPLHHSCIRIKRGSAMWAMLLRTVALEWLCFFGSVWEKSNQRKGCFIPSLGMSRTQLGLEPVFWHSRIEELWYTTNQAVLSFICRIITEHQLRARHCPGV